MIKVITIVAAVVIVIFLYACLVVGKRADEMFNEFYLKKDQDIQKGRE